MRPPIVLVALVVFASTCSGFIPATNMFSGVKIGNRAATMHVRPAVRVFGSGLRSARAEASTSPKPFELPPVLGLAFKSLNKRLVVITGTTSGLGLATLKSLLSRRDSFVVCAVRDVQRMKDIIAREGLDTGAVAVLKLDLASFQSVRDFVFNLKAFKSNFALDTLICNAATYQPATPVPRFTEVSSISFRSVEGVVWPLDPDLLPFRALLWFAWGFELLSRAVCLAGRTGLKSRSRSTIWGTFSSAAC